MSPASAQRLEIPVNMERSVALGISVGETSRPLPLCCVCNCSRFAYAVHNLLAA